MNTLKITALLLSATLMASGLSGCTRTHVETEKPYGENYVREMPEEAEQAAEEAEEKIKTSTEHMKEQVRETTEDWGPNRQSDKDIRYEAKEGKQPHESYSKETHKTEQKQY